MLIVKPKKFARFRFNKSLKDITAGRTKLTVSLHIQFPQCSQLFCVSERLH